MASDVVRLQSVSEDGELVTVWTGTTFSASDSRSEVATIDFVNRDDDADLEIVRTGQLIDCGEDCFCREGSVLAEFEQVFDWDAESGRFTEIN